MVLETGTTSSTTARAPAGMRGKGTVTDAVTVTWRPASGTGCLTGGGDPAVAITKTLVLEDDCRRGLRPSVRILRRRDEGRPTSRAAWATAYEPAWTRAIIIVR